MSRGEETGKPSAYCSVFWPEVKHETTAYILLARTLHGPTSLHLVEGGTICLVSGSRGEPDINEHWLYVFQNSLSQKSQLSDISLSRIGTYDHNERNTLSRGNGITLNPLGQRNICASKSGRGLIWVGKQQYPLLTMKKIYLAIPVSQ